MTELEGVVVVKVWEMNEKDMITGSGYHNNKENEREKKENV